MDHSEFSKPITKNTNKMKHKSNISWRSFTPIPLETVSAISQKSNFSRH